MSYNFNFTPPPAEVVASGQIASYVLCAALLFVPNVPVGALIGSVGFVVIETWVASYGRGEFAGVSMILGVPFWGVAGALVGAMLSFVGRTAFQFFRKSWKRKAVPTGKIHNQVGYADYFRGKRALSFQCSSAISALATMSNSISRIATKCCSEVLAQSQVLDAPRS